MHRITLILTTACVMLAWPANAGGGCTVHAGQSIQAAINGARRGDQIVVEAGTYAEQLTIEKDGISLIGRGAILVPPASPVQNLCSGIAGPGSQAGICVAGSGVKFEPFSSEHQKVDAVDRPVKGVTITGFQVQGFSGENIAVIGGQDTQIYGNQLTNGGTESYTGYGFLAAGSKNTNVRGNVVTASGGLHFIALCTDDMSPAMVSQNRLSGYFVGLCVQTSGSQLQYNNVHGCCAGAFIDPNVKDITFRYNHIGASDPRCATQWPFNAGILLDGSVNAKVQFNIVERQHAGGMAAGIAVGDDPTTTPPAVASGNLVSQNILRDNDLDIYVNTTGTGNVVQKNICSTSFPSGLCTAK